MGGTPFLDQDDGVPPCQVGMGYPPVLTWDLDGGYPHPNQNSMLCTWYAAGDMPFAFTQEDFLVFDMNM